MNTNILAIDCASVRLKTFQVIFPPWSSRNESIRLATAFPNSSVKVVDNPVTGLKHTGWTAKTKATNA